MSSFGGSVKLTGESEYRKALSGIATNLKVLNSEMKAVTSLYDKNDTSVDNLSAQHEILNKKIVEQRNAVDILADALEKSKAETGENSKETKDWQIKLNNAQAELNKLNRELYANADSLAEARTNEEKLNNTKKTTINSFRDFSAELIKSVAGASNLGQTIKNDLNVRVDEMADKVIDGVDKIKAFGDAVVHPKKLGDAIKEKLVDIADKVKSSTNEQADSVEDFGKEAEKSGEKTLKLGDIIKANLISEAIKGGLKALADGFKAIGSAMGECLTAGAEYADNILTLSAQTGLSTDTLEKYNAVAELTDVSMETLTNSMAKNIKSMSEARNGSKAYAEAYAKLGVSITDADGNLRDSEAVYWETIDALKGITNETERDALAMELFGKKSQDLNTIIEMGSEGVAEYTEKAESMGAVLGGKGLEALGNLDDQMQIFKSTTGATKNILASAFAPAISTALGGVNGLAGSFNGLISAIISGDAGGIQGAMTMVSEQVTAMVNNVSEIAPQLITIASDLLSTLFQVITDNLPMLLECGVNLLSSLIEGISSSLDKLFPIVMTVVRTLVQAFVTNLPMIIEMGIQMIVSLINGIAEMIPELIPMAIDCIITIVETLIDNLDLIIDAAINIIMALADGLLEALPDLIDKIPIIIDKLIVAITDNLPKLIEMGITLTIKLAEGLIKAIPQLVAKIPQIITSLVNGLINGLGKMAEVGKNLVQGLWNGISNATQWVLDKIKGFGQSILDGICDFFGINSPSRLFKEQIGTNLALGVGEGFADTMKDVSDEMNEAIPTEFDADISTNINGLTASPMTQFDMMVSAFKKALTEVKVVMDDREMGGFVTNTVERLVYA